MQTMTKAPDTHYSPLIRQALAKMNRRELSPIHVEAWMRVTHPCLDALAMSDFQREIRESVIALDAAGFEQSNVLAMRMGLPTVRRPDRPVPLELVRSADVHPIRSVCPTCGGDLDEFEQQQWFCRACDDHIVPMTPVGEGD